MHCIRLWSLSLRACPQGRPTRTTTDAAPAHSETENEHDEEEPKEDLHHLSFRETLIRGLDIRAPALHRREYALPRCRAILGARWAA